MPRRTAFPETAPARREPREQKMTRSHRLGPRANTRFASGKMQRARKPVRQLYHPSTLSWRASKRLAATVFRKGQIVPEEQIPNFRKARPKNAASNNKAGLGCRFLRKERCGAAAVRRSKP